MKKLFFIICSLVHLNLSKILFVQECSSVHMHFVEAVKQAKLFNPDKEDVCILINRDMKGISVLEQEGVIIRFFDEIKISENHKLFREKCKKKGPLWRLTNERHLWVQDFMISFNEKDIWQLEVDNMLYVDLKDLQPPVDKISIVYGWNYAGVPSIMHFPTYQHSKILCDFINHLADAQSEEVNDMVMLGEFYKKYSDIVNFLPVTFPHDEFKMNSIFCKKFYENYIGFGCIFDPAMYGQYFAGLSNGGKISPKTYWEYTWIVYPSRYKYVWIKDAKGRGVPYIDYEGQLIRIANIHVHSKRLEIFSSLVKINPFEFLDIN